MEKRILIVGGGLIGLSLGWELARQGVAVRICERGRAGREASRAAAGMLSALAEVHFEEEDLLRLGLESEAIYPVVEIWAGLRPASRGHAPILGRTSVENLFEATGHFRKEVLLAPVTAREMASLLLTGKTSDLISSMGLERFGRRLG